MLNFGGEPIIRLLFYTMGSSRSCFGSPCECAAGRDRGCERRARRGNRCLSCAAPRGGGVAVERDLCSAWQSTEPCPARNHVASARHIKQREGWSGAEKHRNRRRRLSGSPSLTKASLTAHANRGRLYAPASPAAVLTRARTNYTDSQSILRAFLLQRCKDKRQSKKDLPRAPQQTPPPCTQPCAQSL